MFNKTAEIFVHKNGLSGVERLRKLANQGASLYDIATTFNVSVATAGRLRQTLLKQVYYISDATSDWLHYCEQRHTWIAGQHRQQIDNGSLQNPHLILVHGDIRDE